MLNLIQSFLSMMSLQLSHDLRCFPVLVYFILYSFQISDSLISNYQHLTPKSNKSLPSFINIISSPKSAILKACTDANINDYGLYNLIFSGILFK